MDLEVIPSIREAVHQQPSVNYMDYMGTSAAVSKAYMARHCISEHHKNMFQIYYFSVWDSKKVRI